MPFYFILSTSVHFRYLGEQQCGFLGPNAWHNSSEIHPHDIGIPPQSLKLAKIVDRVLLTRVDMAKVNEGGIIISQVIWRRQHIGVIEAPSEKAWKQAIKELFDYAPSSGSKKRSALTIIWRIISELLGQSGKNDEGEIFGEADPLSLKADHEEEVEAERGCEEVQVQDQGAISEETSSPPGNVSIMHKTFIDLEKTQERLDGVLSEIKKSFSYLEQPEATLSDKAQLLLQISEGYLSITEFEKSIVAAKKAIDLLATDKSQDKTSAVVQFNLFRCLTEASFGVFDYENVNYFYEKARNIVYGLQKTAEGYEILNTSLIAFEYRWSRLNQTNKAETTRRMGRAGGTFKVPDCKIYFPKKSLPAEMLIHASTHYPVPDVPEGSVLITPMLSLNPTIKLNVEAEVTLKSWLASSAAVQICYKKTEESPWEELRSYRGNIGDNIEFKIRKFCKFACFVRQDRERTYRIRSVLVFNIEDSKMTNYFAPESEASLEKVTKDAEGRGYKKKVCSIDPILEVKIDDSIKISIEKARFADGSKAAERQEETLEVEDKFLTWKYYDPLDFVLPEASKRIMFTHAIKHYRQGVLVLDPILHPKDCVTPKSSRSSPDPEQVNAMYYVKKGTMTNKFENSQSNLKAGDRKRRRSEQGD